MKYFTVPLLLTLLIAVMCTKVVADDSDNLCSITCQCFGVDDSTTSQGKDADSIFDQKSLSRMLAWDATDENFREQKPMLWAFLMPYVASKQLYDNMTRHSMLMSLPTFRPETGYEAFSGGSSWAYAGYLSGYTSKYFIVRPLYKNFRLVRTDTNLDDEILMTCVTHRQSHAIDYDVYKFDRKMHSHIFPSVETKEELTMCTWTVYRDFEPQICTEPCKKNKDCRYRTVQTAGGIVWTINRQYLGGKWNRMALDFMKAFNIHRKKLNYADFMKIYDKYLEISDMTPF